MVRFLSLDFAPARLDKPKGVAKQPIPRSPYRLVQGAKARLSRSKNKRTPRRVSTERRRVARRHLKLLTAFRCLDANKESRTGFVRTLNLSLSGALLESPDEFALNQVLSLEFLLDNNRIAQVDGRVTRVTKCSKFYHVAVEFDKLSPQARRLIKLQVAE